MNLRFKNINLNATTQIEMWIKVFAPARLGVDRGVSGWHQRCSERTDVDEIQAVEGKVGETPNGCGCTPTRVIPRTS